jgi:3-phosphoshikimate 1-carboxyvinyltransferase
MKNQASSKLVAPAPALRGEIAVPGDKSISHRVAMLCGVAAGESVVRGFLRAEDCLHTVSALGALGARTHFHPDGVLHIEGNAGNIIQPVGALDMGNSGTGLRLLAGLLAGRAIEVELTGDASLRSRPMGRIKEPLEKMGASVELLGETKGGAPLRIKGGALRGIDYDLPVASAQVKSCILFAALYAEGPTRLRERLATRDHTERLLRAMGIPVRAEGLEIEIEGHGAKGPPLKGGEWSIPGDFSSAAFWIAGAAATRGSSVVVRHVGLNPRRTALLDVLERMGARIERRGVRGEDWEPTGDLAVTGADLKGVTVGGGEIPNLIDEIPILAAVAALADGETVIKDAAELRVKESDRIATMCANLRLLGVEAEERPDGLAVRGPVKPAASQELKSHGDHRIAMAAAVLAARAAEPSVIHNVACVDTSYPSFWSDLEALSAGGAAHREQRK